MCDNDFVKHVAELQLYLECLLTEGLPVAELGVTYQAVLVPILIMRKLNKVAEEEIQTFDEKNSSTSALLMLTPCSLKTFTIFDEHS